MVLGALQGPEEAVSFGITVWGTSKHFQQGVWSNFYIHSTSRILRKMGLFSGGVDVSLYVTNFYPLGNTLRTFK